MKLKSNNIIGALTLFYIFITIFSTYKIHDYIDDEITGRMSYGVATMCISKGRPWVNVDYPSLDDIVNGTISVKASAGSPNDNITLDVQFEHIGPSTLGYIGQDNDGSDGSYNITWNTSNYPDGSCSYVIIGRVGDYCGDWFEAQGGRFSINNFDREPIWNNFKNNLTTNFSEYTKWISIANATIGVPLRGLLNFSGKTINFDDANLDRDIIIGQNMIGIDTGLNRFGCLYGTEISISIFNVSVIYPAIIRNGEPCPAPDCTIEHIGEDYVVFDTVVYGRLNFSVTEGGNVSINITMNNKTYDNSPSFGVLTHMSASNKTKNVTATCYYKTDFSPLDYTAMDKTNSHVHASTMLEQNVSYTAITGLSIYDEIEHYDYVEGEHRLYVKCVTIGGNASYANQSFEIIHPKRDRVYYENDTGIVIKMELEKPNLNITADFSGIDSNYATGTEVVVNNGLNYTIYYNISESNTIIDGQKTVYIEARNNSQLDMNATIFAHLHNLWYKSDVDYAFACWNYNPGWYFDEIGCDWESDLNHAADKKDYYTVEADCFDSIDNDLDTLVDCEDTDCQGQYYECRWDKGIASAIIPDPCVNNVCTLCLGGPEGSNGRCTTSQGITVEYTQQAPPGGRLKVHYVTGALPWQTVWVSVNQINSTFGVDSSSSSIRQLPTKLVGLGGISVTASSFIDPINNKWGDILDEQIEIGIPITVGDNAYSNILVGKSIESIAAYTNLEFFKVNSSGITNESDYVNLSGYRVWCNDGIDNDLDSFLWVGNYSVDCQDLDCNGSYIAAGQRCEYGIESSCNDGFDNDGDGFTDCEDDDCFKNGIDCPLVEDISPSTCSDGINNDHDYGAFCDPLTSRSLQSGGGLPLTDCIDIDCNGEIGNPLDSSGLCEYCTELTCNDAFDNDADGQYDCIGNAYRTIYERDCDRWHASSYLCPATETICNDNLDNDLDSDSINGGLSYNGLPVYGGYDCIDQDCNGSQGALLFYQVCEWGDETICYDSFDNDGDGNVDCYDSSSCWGSSGNGELKGLCRPCPAYENITIDSCADGLDSDYDGTTDCSDPDCYGQVSSTGFLCGAVEICNDTIDNDGDNLIDGFDYSDCPSKNELGPGQCRDTIDNDGDGFADCADSDCADLEVCSSIPHSTDCTFYQTIGLIDICYSRALYPGENFTVGFEKIPADFDSVWLKVGNFNKSLTQLTNPLTNSNTFMTGTTENFTKIVDTYGVKAQNTNGFKGNLSIQLGSVIDTSTSPGTYEIFISTSVPGFYGEGYVLANVLSRPESEIPLITGIHPANGSLVGGPEVTITVNATDNQTYNSGIDYCQFNITGTWEDDDDCIYMATLYDGMHTISVRAVDGAGNIGTINTTTFNVSEAPYQMGDFYGYRSLPESPNFPERDHFRLTQTIGVGVKFNGSGGFTTNTTGCIVKFYSNNGSLKKTNYILLNASNGFANCYGDVIIDFNNDFYYIDVEVKDNRGVSGISEIQIIWVCDYDNMTTLLPRTNNTDYCYGFPCHEWQQVTGYFCKDPCAYNSAPICNITFPDRTGYEDSPLTGVVGWDLDDYCFDPDGDPLTYNSIEIDVIDVSFDSQNIVTFTPQSNWYGSRILYITATDPYGLYDNTNNFTVTFIDVPEPPPPAPPPPPPKPEEEEEEPSRPPIHFECPERWNCTDWSMCKPEGIQTRRCIDLNDCGSRDEKPKETQACIYIPTCNDSIKNQGEVGVDCGGPCGPCPTCNDSIKNQGEVGVDCGGPCGPCPSCFDGIKNQNETGVDCGGLCGPCPTCNDGKRNQGEEGIDCGGPCSPCVEVPGVIGWGRWIWIIILVILIIAGSLSYRYTRPYIIRFWLWLLALLAALKRRRKEAILTINIGELIINKLEELERRLKRRSLGVLTEELSSIMKLFSKLFFNIEYEFTNQELAEELKKQRVSLILQGVLVNFFERLSEIRFSGYELEEREFRILIKQAVQIVEQAMRLGLGIIEITIPKKEEEAFRKLRKKIKAAEEKNDINTAKKLKTQLMKMYKDVTVEQKGKIFKDIEAMHKKLEKGEK